MTLSNFGRHESKDEELLRRVDHARRQDCWRRRLEQDRGVVAEVLKRMDTQHRFRKRNSVEGLTPSESTTTLPALIIRPDEG